MNNYGVDPVDAALYEAAHNYRDPVLKKRGIPALAERMHMNEGTLQNKVNTTMRDHKVTKDEFEEIMIDTNDLKPLVAMCTKFHLATFRIDANNDMSDSALIDLIADVDIEKGEFMRALKKALEDGQITRAEYADLVREGHDVINAMMSALDRLKGMVADHSSVVDMPNMGGGK